MDWQILVFYPEPEDNSSTCTFTTEKSVTFTGTCANEIIPSINRSFVYKAKEGRRVRIYVFTVASTFILQVNPNFAYAFTLLGHEYVFTEELDKAMSCFRNAIRVDPRHYNAWYV